MRAGGVARRAADRAVIDDGGASRLADEERGSLLPPNGGVSGAGGLQTVQEEFAEQDATLDRMSESLAVLAVSASAIAGELEAQAVMTDEASLSMELARGDADAVSLRIKKFINERAGGPSMCCILTALTTILIVLTWVAFS